MTSSPHLVDLTAKIRQMVPLLETMQLEIVEASEGRAATRIPFEPNRNHLGGVWGGALFGVAEVVGGVLVMTSFPGGLLLLARDLRIRYLKPTQSDVTASTTMTPGELADVLARLEEHGRTDFTVDITLTDVDGLVTGRVEATYYARLQS